MDRSKFLVLAIIFLFVLNLLTLGYLLLGKHAPPPMQNFDERVEPLDRRVDGPGRDKPQKPDGMIISKLKLNETQIKKFEGLKKEHRRQVEDIQFASKKLHDEYYGLLKADPVDSVKANNLLEQISVNQKQLDKVTFEHFSKIKDICDTEQKELFAHFIDEISRSFNRIPPPK